MQSDQPILYVEDSDDDVFLLQRAFVQARIPQPIVTVRDGRAAVDYLGSVTPGASGLRSARPAPGLVLLDLQLPRMNGLEVLKWIRSQPEPVGKLPVVVLSTSSVDQDIDRAFGLGANGYLTKPASLTDLDALVRGLKEAFKQVNSAEWSRIRGARLPADSGTPPGGAVPS